MERNERPLVSVIVPVYKVEAYLEECVESILGQTYTNLEVWLVDDGSPDSCSALCDAFAQRDSRVRVIHKENGGLSSARNAALDVCTGAYITFVDSDDWIEPTLCADALERVRTQGVDIVIFPAYQDRGGERVVLFQDYPDGTVLEPAAVMEKCLRNEITAYVWRRFCHRRCWEQVRFPEGQNYEDLAVTHLPFLYAERPVGFLDKPLYHYRINETGITQSVSPKKWYHFFLGFQTQYRFAVDSGLTEVAEICLKTAAEQALQFYSDTCRHQWAGNEADIADIRAFLRETKGELLRSAKASRSLKLRVRLFCACVPAYGACVKGSMLLRR